MKQRRATRGPLSALSHHDAERLEERTTTLEINLHLQLQEMMHLEQDAASRMTPGLLLFSSSITLGSAKVDVSPRSCLSKSGSASFRKILRIILPDRVLGNP